MSQQKLASVAKFKNKEALIGIVGLGYVGLPLMLRYNAIGYQVLGIDIDEDKVGKLNAGESYIEHIPADKIATDVTDDETNSPKCVPDHAKS